VPGSVRLVKSLPAIMVAVSVVAAWVLAGGCGGDPAATETRTASPSALEVSLEPLAGTFSQPVYVTSAPGDSDRLFVVEKTGAIRIIEAGVVGDRPFLDLSGAVSGGGEQGLLSMAFDPDHAANGRFYVCYTDADGTVRVAVYRVASDDRGIADPNSREELLALPQPYANHNGGQLQFGPDGLLYLGTGDGGGAGDPQARSQDPGNQHGKILRIDPRSRQPTAEVYAVGLRNPWRFSFDRTTGALWIGDVGQSEREEVDYLPPDEPPGANLGWNGYEGSLVYDRGIAAGLDEDALVWPATEYGHDEGRSVTGGYVYRGSALPALRGHYVFGDFASGRVWTLDGPEGVRRPLEGADGLLDSIASFGEDSAGELYIVSLEGSVHRVVPVE
jgi:glucose/arabinose dehydrogenase